MDIVILTHESIPGPMDSAAPTQLLRSCSCGYLSAACPADPSEGSGSGLSCTIRWGAARDTHIIQQYGHCSKIRVLYTMHQTVSVCKRVTISPPPRAAHSPLRPSALAPPAPATFLRTEPVAGRNEIGANVCQIRRCAHRRFRQPCIPYNPFREQPPSWGAIPL